jgi:hypothetical protein
MIHSVSAVQLAQALNRIDIVCQAVVEGNPKTSEHGEVSINTSKRAMTVFVSPTDDTMYLAVWQPHKSAYKLCPTYHYAGQFHRLIRDIRQHL